MTRPLTTCRVTLRAPLLAQFACLWRVVVDIEGGELQGDSVNWITGALCCKCCVDWVVPSAHGSMSAHNPLVTHSHPHLPYRTLPCRTAYDQFSGASIDVRDHASLYFTALYWSCMTITTVG